MAKYTFMAFIHQTVSLVSSEKLEGSATFISKIWVVVDIGFVGGALGWAGGSVVGGWTMTEGTTRLDIWGWVLLVGSRVVLKTRLGI